MKKRRITANFWMFWIRRRSARLRTGRPFPCCCWTDGLKKLTTLWASLVEPGTVWPRADILVDSTAAPLIPLRPNGGESSSLILSGGAREEPSAWQPKSSRRWLRIKNTRPFPPALRFGIHARRRVKNSNEARPEWLYIEKAKRKESASLLPTRPAAR